MAEDSRSIELLVQRFEPRSTAISTAASRMNCVRAMTMIGTSKQVGVLVRTVEKIQVFFREAAEVIAEQQKKDPIDVADYNAEFWSKTSKGAFDFVKNIIVAATLGVMSDKTNSWLLYVISCIMGFLAFTVVASQIDRLIVYVSPINTYKRKWIVFIGFAITALAYWYFSRVLTQIAAAIR